jgi:hypothetical protein
MNPMEGNTNEIFYLCEGILLNPNDKTMKDEFNHNRELSFSNIDNCILILEREVQNWLLAPMSLLIDNDIANKSKYVPYKNSIFALFGIFSYIEKIQRYKDGKPYTSGDTQSTTILTYGFKQLFPEDENTQYGNNKIKKILENTRHSLMHSGNIGDNVLLNNDYENSSPVVYKGSNNNLQKIEIIPYKMKSKIIDDFEIYIEALREVSNIELRENFQIVFDEFYNNEISMLR